MKEILIKNAIRNRDRDYDYLIDKEGNLIREKYNYFKDWRTYLVLFLVIMGFLYYMDIKEARYFTGSYCVQKCLLENQVNLTDFSKNLTIPNEVKNLTDG